MRARWGDCIKRLRYVSRDSPDLMSDIEGLHPLLGERKQYVQGRVTRSESESELIISEMGPLEKRKNLMSTAMVDSMTSLMIGSKLRGSV